MQSLFDRCLREPRRAMDSGMLIFLVSAATTSVRHGIRSGRNECGLGGASCAMTMVVVRWWQRPPLDHNCILVHIFCTNTSQSRVRSALVLLSQTSEPAHCGDLVCRVNNNRSHSTTYLLVAPRRGQIGSAAHWKTKRMELSLYSDWNLPHSAVLSCTPPNICASNTVCMYLNRSILKRVTP